MQGFENPCQNVRLGSFSRLEFVPVSWVARSGYASNSGVWVGGIALKEGKQWLSAQGNVGSRGFTNELQRTPHGVVYNRQISLILNPDTVIEQSNFKEIAHRRVVLRAIMSDGSRWLLTTPQYPFTFAFATNYGNSPSEMVKHQVVFSTTTPKQLFQWNFVTPSNPNINILTPVGGSGGGGTSVSITPTEVLEDTDSIVFARKNAAGEVVAYHTYPSEKYKRIIRGIRLSAPSHLDGLGIKTANGDTWIETKNSDGTPIFTKI